MAGSKRAGGARRGFAAMDPERQREIASRGGSASGGNFRHDPVRAVIAGRKGGEAGTGAPRSTIASPPDVPAE